MEKIYDAIVVGGGPAGLSCALVLGRCRRRVLVFDTSSHRNKASLAMHAFPSREGENPKVFLNTVKDELSNYGIRIRKKEITDVQNKKKYFVLQAATGETYRCRKLLLATGVTDMLPPIKNADKYYGRGVYHCPYCDGWEQRDKPWLVYALSGKAATELCLRLKTWTTKVSLLGHYTRLLRRKDAELLARNGVKVLRSAVKEITGRDGKLKAVEMEDGSTVKCEALFFSSSPKQQSQLADKLGCRRTKKGNVDFNRLQETNVPGLFVAGDMARDMQLMLIAAAEGAKAAVVINTLLNKEGRSD